MMKNTFAGMPASDEFLAPHFGPYTMDIYLARAAILSALCEALPEFQGTVLDIGCGQQPYRQLLLAPPSRARRYVGVDLANEYNLRKQPDLIWDGVRLPVEDSFAGSVLLTEVLEHCPDPESVLREAWRVLKPGGFLFLSVPSIWPLHDVPHDFHRFTPFGLQRLLERAGFAVAQIQLTGGWDRSLAQVVGLWVRRRPMKELTRRILARLLLPVCKLLVKLEKAPPSWESGPLFPGICAHARKPLSGSPQRDDAVS